MYHYSTLFCAQIGNPCKPFKSILVGEDAHVLKRFIHILSYFLRCRVTGKRKVCAGNILDQYLRIYRYEITV